MAMVRCWKHGALLKTWCVSATKVSWRDRRSIRRRNDMTAPLQIIARPGSFVLLLFVVGVFCLLPSGLGARERNRSPENAKESEKWKEMERTRARDKMGQYPWVPSWPAFSIRRIIHFFPIPGSLPATPPATRSFLLFFTTHRLYRGWMAFFLPVQPPGHGWAAFRSIDQFRGGKRPRVRHRWKFLSSNIGECSKDLDVAPRD